MGNVKNKNGKKYDVYMKNIDSHMSLEMADNVSEISKCTRKIIQPHPV